MGGGHACARALGGARAARAATDTVPSARVLRAMRDGHHDSFVSFVRTRSADTRAQLLALPYPAALKARFDALAAASITEQKRIESMDSMPFEIYRQEYTSPKRLGRGQGAVMVGAESV